MSAPTDSRTEVIIKARAAERAASRPISTMSPTRARALWRIRDRLPGVTTHAQQQRMLAAILSVGVTVIEARTFLLVSNPSDAVSRLPSAVRDLIRRTPVVWQDAMGNLRNTVRYELFDEDVG